MNLKICVISPLVALALAACGPSEKNPDGGNTDSATEGATEGDDSTSEAGTEEPTGPGTEAGTTEGEVSVTVEDPRAMCAGEPLVPEPEPAAAPTLTAQALSDGKVAVSETEYEENCGFSLTPVVTVEPGTVTISYETSGEAADCVCPFTIDYTLVGLTPGAWTIVSGELTTTVDVT